MWDVCVFSYLVLRTVAERLDPLDAFQPVVLCVGTWGVWLRDDSVAATADDDDETGGGVPDHTGAGTRVLNGGAGYHAHTPDRGGVHASQQAVVVSSGYTSRYSPTTPLRGGGPGGGVRHAHSIDWTPNLHDPTGLGGSWVGGGTPSPAGGGPGVGPSPRYGSFDYVPPVRNLHFGGGGGDRFGYGALVDVPRGPSLQG